MDVPTFMVDMVLPISSMDLSPESFAVRYLAPAFSHINDHINQHPLDDGHVVGINIHFER